MPGPWDLIRIYHNQTKNNNRTCYMLHNIWALKSNWPIRILNNLIFGFSSQFLISICCLSIYCPSTFWPMIDLYWSPYLCCYSCCDLYLPCAPRIRFATQDSSDQPIQTKVGSDQTDLSRALGVSDWLESRTGGARPTSVAHWGCQIHFGQALAVPWLSLLTVEDSF